MNKGYENAINFLLYAYFGITLESDEEKIVKRVIEKAYNDATLKGAFNTLISKGDTQLRDNANRARDKSAQYLIEAIMNFNGSYASCHKKLCEKLCIKDDCFYKDVNKDKILFSYGNAQKWVNMTVKYIYIVENILEEIRPDHPFCRIGSKFTGIVNELDIPIDSYIIQALWDKDELWDKDDIKPLLNDEKMCKDGKRGAYSGEKVKPWSTWENDDYRNFSIRLHENDERLIDWETPAWIDIKEKRRNKSWIDKLETE